ncbi:unnamed protein product [Heligmosomoides polygyrus]|uniref:Histone-arginine methyltransferase CARM1 n=1 Tax=Heligmosomoides polygyrus TaxID=6339 RepID=A0A183G0A0_HELPZ|nr:unnamed protein product [Heligmosomoides polygyrus]
MMARSHIASVAGVRSGLLELRVDVHGKARVSEDTNAAYSPAVAGSEEQFFPDVVFFCRHEFRAVFAYEIMFWTGVTDVGQLIVFDVSGMMAITQYDFCFFVNKVFCQVG